MYRLRRNRKPSYDHIHQRGILRPETLAAVRKVQVPPSNDELTDDFHSTVMSQYYVNKGLKVFGDLGSDAVLNEMKQVKSILISKIS